MGTSIDYREQGSLPVSGVTSSYKVTGTLARHKYKLNT